MIVDVTTITRPRILTPTYKKQTQRKKEEIKRQEEEARNRREHTVEDSKIVDGLFGFLGDKDQGGSPPRG